MPGIQQKKKDGKLAYSGFMIERTARRMKQAIQKILAEHDTGITADQWIILNLLSEHAPLSQFELAEKSFKDAPTITRMLDLMIKKELVERLPDPEDRRRFQVILTETGRKKHRHTLPLVREIRSIGYENLSEKDLNLLMRIMDTIYTNFETHKNSDHALL